MSATPAQNSVYAQYVNTPLPVYINVMANPNGQPYPSYIQTICYKPQTAANFGSTYFEIGEIIFREMNFAGIFAITRKTDYTSSPYSFQENWLASTTELYYAKAIIKVEVWAKRFPETNFTLKGTFMNSNLGEPLKVNYADCIGRNDKYEFRMYLLVKSGTYFIYKLINTWYFWDNINFGDINGKPYEAIGLNGGKTVMFTVGNCTSPNGTYIFPHYQNLPNTATLSVWEQWGPGSLGSQFNAALSNVQYGCEISNSIYPGYSAKETTLPVVGQSIGVNVYSSLYLNLLPQSAQATFWPKVNWLINHIGLSGTNSMFYGYTWSDLQGAIWLLRTNPWNGIGVGGVPNVTPMMTMMASAANSYGNNYSPPTGGWTCVLFDGTSGIRIIFSKE